jgi:hypothetical protein
MTTDSIIWMLPLAWGLDYLRTRSLIRYAS